MRFYLVAVRLDIFIAQKQVGYGMKSIVFMHELVIAKNTSKLEMPIEGTVDLIENS